jgi:aminoglycoside phosphotransferase (APT) family kinase protein
MTTKHDLTTAKGLYSYLVARGDEPNVVESLSGGFANYIYRATHLNSDQVYIFRHAASYLSSNKDFQLEPDRIYIEAAVLRAMPDIEKESPSTARAVKYFGRDEKQWLLRLEDGGNCNLKQAYSDGSLDIREIAFDLAKWLAYLHSSTLFTAINVPELNLQIGEHGNNLISVKACRYSYNELGDVFKATGQDPQLAERINHEFGSLLATDDECLCHGDFWPGNVVVGSKIPDHLLPKLTIVDWEMVRRGNSATDVGQFAAEAWLLDTFKGNRSLRINFLNAYALARRWATHNPTVIHLAPIGKKWIRRMTAHFAVHIAFWPTKVPWTTEEKTNHIVGLGASLLRCVLNNNWEAIQKSFLFEGLSSDWDEAFLGE